MKHKFEIEIDLEEMRIALQEQAVYKIKHDYFDCKDLEHNWKDIKDWDERSKVQEKYKSERLNTIAHQINWDKLPEIMKNKMAEDFMKRFINFKAD